MESQLREAEAKALAAEQANAHLEGAAAARAKDYDRLLREKENMLRELEKQEDKVHALTEVKQERDQLHQVRDS